MKGRLDPSVNDVGSLPISFSGFLLWFELFDERCQSVADCIAPDGALSSD